MEQLFITVNLKMTDHLREMVKSQDKYMIAKEVGKVAGNEHYHIFVQSNRTKSYKSYADKFRNYIKKHYDGKFNEFNIKKVTPSTWLRVCAYCSKDNGQVEHNLQEDEIDAIIEIQQKVKASQETPMKDKLLQHLVDHLDSQQISKDEFVLSSSYIDEIKKQIFKFYKKIKWLPPNKSQMYQYVCYIMLHINSDEDKAVVDIEFMK